MLVRDFLKESWQALRADWHLLFPYLFLFGVGQAFFSDVVSPNQFSLTDFRTWFFILYWLAGGLFFKSWFLLYRREQYKKRVPDLFQSMIDSVPMFFKLLLYSLGILVGPVALAFALFSISGLFSSALSSVLGVILGVCLYVVGLLFVVFIEVFHVVVVFEDVSFYESIQTTYKWVCYKFSIISRTVVVSYVIGVVLTVFSAAFLDIPGLGKGFFSVVFQSFGSVMKQLIITSCVVALMKLPPEKSETVDVPASEGDLS